MVAVTLIVYLVALLAIGLWAQRRTGDTGDFHLAGRRMGPVIAALSASASSSSAWTLLGVSGAAYAWGLQAVWLVPAIVSGFFINWVFIAPKLQPASRQTGSLTLVEFLSHGSDVAYQRRLRTLGALIILFCFTFYVASQFQAAGAAIGTALPVEPSQAMLAGAAIVIAYVFLGGFWAASVTDALQGLMMLFVALVLPVVALTAAGGPAGVAAGLRALDDPSLMMWVDQPGWLLGLAYTLVVDDHVRVDVIHERLSLKTQGWIELFGLLLLLLPFLGIAIYEMIPYALSSYQVGETSQAPAGLPHRWVLKAILALAFMLIALAAVSRLFKVTALLFGFPRPLKPRTSQPETHSQDQQGDAA